MFVKFIFSEVVEEGTLAMEGTVQQKGLAQPTDVNNTSYRTLVRDRSDQGNKKTRIVQAIDTSVALAQRPNAAPNFNLSRVRKKPSESIAAADKRERMPREELIDRVFGGFEKRNYYNLKELIQHTNQPTNYLKEILNEICIYNKRGPNKGLFELKPEYKHRKSELKQ